MLNKMIKVALVAVLAVSSSSVFARSYNDQRVRVEVSPRYGIQIKSPYVRNKHYEYERAKREVINYPSRTLNNVFRELDRIIDRKINRW